MAKYQEYEEYKDSGVEWLGEIPNHWEVNRHKYVASFLKGRNPTELSDDYVEGYFPYLSMDSLRGKSHSKFAPLVRGLFLAREGQPLIIWDGSNAGEFVLGKEGIVSSTMAAAFLNMQLDPQYYWYLCLCFEPEMRRHANGMGIPHVNGDELKNINLGVPAKLEQTQIANFLDHETAQIDTLIDKQQTLIQLLKEKRQAVISHAVTKGLNPDAPMKDSGVEWLGEVPEHWEVKGIKRLSEIKRGASPRPIADQKYFDDEGEYAWTRIADVSRAGMYLDTTTQRLSDLGASLSVKLEVGELFLSIAGTVGKPCITISKACIHDGFVYFPTLKINNKFLFYIFEAGQAYLGLGKMGTQLNLNTETVGGIEIGLPPKEEIEAIIKYIENEKARFDHLIDKAEQAIQLMQERRTALISAAVTGKIDVRGWRAPE